MCWILPLSLGAVADQATDVVELRIHYKDLEASDPSEGLHLRGSDARQQILVSAMLVSGGLRDLTRSVVFRVEPEDRVRVDAGGMVTPVANGKARIVASAPGLEASIEVTVEDVESVTPVNFANQIVPVFTKAGCNGGGCHGKSGGQNGFRLSLLGFEPAEDFEHLVKEARGRRLFPAAPENSLLLLKAVGTLPHGGGKRIESDSDDYRLLVRWIRQGMPFGKASDPTVVGIDVVPKQRTMPMESPQQLVVTALYSDGSREDVTRSALYEPNDKEMAEVDSQGHVRLFSQPGDVAVMVRYQAKVAVFRATVPLGAGVVDLPPVRNFIDELVFGKLKTVGMPPSPVCDDETFLRRVTLDITGRLPTPAETAEFLAQSDASRRDRCIDRLLQDGGYADFFANKWSALLRNKRSNDTHARGTFAFYSWIRDGLYDNKPFDQFAREIVAASGQIDQNPPVAWYRQTRDSTAQLEDTAQLFLGTRLKCAQCHHHPYERWSQQDYYGFAAFFSQVGRKGGIEPGEEMIFHRRGVAEAVNIKTKSKVRPAGLGAAPFQLSPDDDPRGALADWMSDPENPFFAPSLVNRYWKHFFNRGLVEPEDDMRETNPATNPDLLKALARHFAESGFDLKDLVRTICRSSTYQLSAIPNEHNGVDRQNFSRYYPKRLTAEVLLDSVNRLANAQTPFKGLPDGTRAVQLPDNSYNEGSYFLTVFGRPDMSSACECERSQDASLAQSLHLLNAKDIQEKLSSDSGRPALLAKDTERSDEQKLRELYLLAFAREPKAEEYVLANAHISRKMERVGQEGDPQAAKREAYEDIVWALVNTKEFLFNH
ncbi:MAG: DUF1549 and DUF1553 domain-containing protein [Verrucomicrobia bacterium]|nr:DUF1549 and DUF1553 domain-containing protein [Verrucomicrobiota bacterium]